MKVTLSKDEKVKHDKHHLSMWIQLLLLNKNWERKKKNHLRGGEAESAAKKMRF